MLQNHRVITSKADFYGEKCLACSGRLRVGDVAMVFDRGVGVYVDRDLVWHRRCIAAALAAAPLENAEVAEAIAGIVARWKEADGKAEVHN